MNHSYLTANVFANQENNTFSMTLLAEKSDPIYPVDTGRKVNVHKSFNSRPVSRW